MVDAAAGRGAAAAHHLRGRGQRSRVGQPGAGLESRREADRLRPGRETGAALLRRAASSPWSRWPAARPGCSRPSLDRNVLSPIFSPDGASVLFLLEDDRVYHLARVPAAGGSVERLVAGQARARATSPLGRDGRIAVACEHARPPDRGLRGGRTASFARSPRQNDAWLAEVRLAPLEEISVQEPGRHRDPRLHGQAAGLSGGHAATRRSSGSTAARSGSTTTTSPTSTGRSSPRRATWSLGVNPRGSSGRGEKFSTAIWAAWGEKDGEDVLAAVDWAVAAGHRRSRAPRRRRLELRRHPHQPGHRARPALQGGHQRRGPGERAPGLRDRPVRAWSTRPELGKPWANPEAWRRGLVPLPPRGPHRDADAVPLRRGGLERAAASTRSRCTRRSRAWAGRRELIVYPGESHGIGRPSFVLDRMERYLAWYGKYLGGAASAASAGGR